MIERVNLWGIPAELRPVAYVVPLVCAAIMVWRLWARMRWWWRIGRPERAFDQPLRRLGRVIKYALAQIKVLHRPGPGLIHVAIAWGFFVFFLGTALATIDADFQRLKFLRGHIYLTYKLVLDIFTGIALLGLIAAGYRRFIQRPAQLTHSAGFALSLVIVFLTVLSGLLTEALRLATLSQDPSLQPGWHAGLAWSTPLGYVVGQGFVKAGLSKSALLDLHLALWLVHVGLVGVLFVSIPIGPLLHVITAPLNIFFSKLDRPAGRLEPAYTRDGHVGAGQLSDFTWRQLLQANACTECGRCEAVCPAHLAGLVLSPKRLMTSLKQELRRAARGSSGEFAGQTVEDAFVWACTTCRACVQECPVLVEHVETIVDMRRYLLAQQRADSQLATALGNLRRYGNSFGKSDRQRARWTTGLDFKVKDVRKESAQTLWFAGDYASYSPALAEITVATARTFQRAGLDFGILYDAERNAGNDVRRTGEEGLFELLAQKNLQALSKCQFEEIVTTDPHSYNTLKNEYDWQGMNGSRRPPRILHYSELLLRELAAGRLVVRRPLRYTVTYHDPCYLGRYNGIYEPPRELLRALGCRLVEMPRNRSRALCCGAGGGRIWMEEAKVKERPSENRVREAASCPAVEVFVVACPKDLTMYRDAVKTAGLEGVLVVKDLIELVDDATAAAAVPVPTEPALSAAVSQE